MKITKKNLAQIILGLTLCLNLVTMVITLEKTEKNSQNFSVSKINKLFELESFCSFFLSLLRPSRHLEQTNERRMYR